MKHARAAVLVLAAVLVSNPIVHLQAQAEIQLNEADVVSAKACLQPLASIAVPPSGAFYVLADGPISSGPLLALLPSAPKGSVVYRVRDRQEDVFLADCRKNPQCDNTLRLALVKLRLLLATVQALEQMEQPRLQTSASVSAESMFVQEGDSGSWGPDSLIYGANDLWLQVAVTNSGSVALASFTIHPPDTNSCWDLFGTTNLTAGGWLNLTNWAWILRTEMGETNIVLNNLWPHVGLFRLGTLQDSDSDGLPDAYEKLVSHTDPLSANLNLDSDGDGLLDAWELANGLNPQTDDSALTGSRANFIYDSAGWLRQVNGARNESVTLDNEGNIQSAQ